MQTDHTPHAKSFVSHGKPFGKVTLLTEISHTVELFIVSIEDNPVIHSVFPLLTGCYIPEQDGLEIAQLHIIFCKIKQKVIFSGWDKLFDSNPVTVMVNGILCTVLLFLLLLLENIIIAV